MSTVLYTDVRYYGPHFESMARQWRNTEQAIVGAVVAVNRYFANRAAKQYLRELPDYLLEDIGVNRFQLR